MDKKNYLIKFGQNVRSIRLEKHLSQEKLADITGLHRTYIGMIERGEKNLTLTNIIKLSKALEVNISLFFEGI